MKKDFSRSFLWHKVKSTCIQGCFNSQHLSQGSLQLFPSLTSFCLNLSFRMLRLMFMSISSNAILVGFFFFPPYWILEAWRILGRKMEWQSLLSVRMQQREGHCVFFILFPHLQSANTGIAYLTEPLWSPVITANTFLPSILWLSSPPQNCIFFFSVAVYQLQPYQHVMPCSFFFLLNFLGCGPLTIL